MFLEKKEAKHYEMYKKDSKGKIRYLIIDTIGNKVIQRSGMVGGRETQRDSYCDGKNIGRSNETTGEEQAKLVAKSKFDKKLKEGYFRTKLEAETTVVVLPMLAKSFDKEEDKVVYPCYGQPKLDGMRGLGSHSDQSITSRSGNKVETLQHIIDALPITLGTLDGELYAHGVNFQENMRLIKKYRPGETESVKYHVYDFITDTPMPFEDRYHRLCMLCANIPEIEVVETVVINNKEELLEYHKKNLAAGYEGTMIRWGDAPYKLNGRSSNLLKFKDFIDLALPLMGVEPSEKVPGHGKPYFKWPGATGHRLGVDILGCGVALDHRMRADILKNQDKYIGKTCELRFFEYSETGVPRFPVMYGFRLDK